jgi:electron transfer flavoprotein beta subunit
MRIVVCIKQVPATNDAKIDPETKRIVREGVKAILNPFDTYAIEEGVLLREQLGGEVVALSMGPPKAEATLREAIAQGADRAVLLSHRAFGGSDTWATSYALACAIRTLGGADLVICGKQAIDGDTAQVGPGIAAHLGWPQATHVMRLRSATAAALEVVRMHEDGHDICELSLPAVITVVKDINRPRVPTLKGKLAAQKVTIPVWTPEMIGADATKIGLDGSPTRVVKTEPPPARQKATQRIAGQPAECAAQLLFALRQRSLV